MNKPQIDEDNIKVILDRHFVRVVDIQYAEGRHYYDVTRRPLDKLVAMMPDEEVRSMLADAATCIVIVRTPDEEPRLVLIREYRYPTGQFLLSPPAGLMDPSDREKPQTLFETARREIREETGITVSDSDRMILVNPILFSTPGLTDESNALVCAVVDLPDLSSLSQKGAEGSECFDGFRLLTKKEAARVLAEGKDEFGVPYSMFTWGAMMYFVSGMWEE